MKKTKENSSVKYFLPLKHWHSHLETCKLEFRSFKCSVELNQIKTKQRTLLFSFRQILSDILTYINLIYNISTALP